MKPLVIVLLLAAPAAAQSFEPSSAAVRYCLLRQAGMASRPAMRAAMLEYWDSDRQPRKIWAHGQEFTEDQLRFVDLIRHCG